MSTWPHNYNNRISYTLNLHLDDVVAVLDAVLDLTAVESCVTGPQLGYLDAGVRGSRGVAHQVNSVLEALADEHLSLHGHQDHFDVFFGDEAPFDAMSEGSDGGSSRVWDRVVLYVGYKNTLFIFQPSL